MSESVQLLVERLHAKRSGDGWKAKCPVHDDRKPSISIREGSDGRALIKCHAGCQTNDVLAAISLKPRDLFVSGKNDSEPPKQTLSPKTNDQNPQQFDWQECVAALKLEDLVRLGNERWWSSAFCRWLRDEKKIGLHKGYFAFPVERDGKIVAAKYKWGSGPNDWGVYPTEQGAACFILGDPKRAKNIHLDESQWDMCSLADRTDWFRDADNHAFVATPGSGNAKLIKGLIPSGASALAWPQNDASGEKWLRDLARYADAPIAKAIVPAPHKDLGEWCKAGASPEAIYNAWWRNELLEVPAAIAAPALPELSLKEIIELDLEFLKRFIQFSNPSDALIVAYWCLASWFVQKLNYAPYLFVTSPQPGCGKTTLLDCIDLIVRNPERASGISAAALYRLIEENDPTWIQDEIDTIWGEKADGNEDLRMIFNAGTRRRSAYVYRCGGPNRTRLEKFSVFGFKAVAGIGSGIPQTIRERGFTIFLNKITSDSNIEEAEDEIIVAAAPQTQRVKAAWAETVKLERPERGPALQKALDRRQKECAASLLSLAALTAQQAELEAAIIANFAGSAAENDTATIQLLSDIRDVLADGAPDQLETIQNIILPIRDANGLSASWWEPEKESAAAKWIAKKLKPFRVFPIKWKVNGICKRGYLKSDLLSACSLYLPPLAPLASESTTYAATENKLF